MSQPQSSNRLPWRLSGDAIFFIFFWSAQFWSSQVSGYLLPTPQLGITMVIHLTRVMSYDPLPALLLCVLCAYLGADLWLGGRWQFYVKLVAVWLTIIAFVLIPTGAAIIYRHNTEPQLYIHDGAIQIEEALKFLLAGKNPYVESYAATPMALWKFNEQGLTNNPALDHLIYLPGMLFTHLPFFEVSQFVGGYYDARVVYLLMFLGALMMALAIPSAARDKMIALMVLALNPLFTIFFIEGRNDLVVTFWLMAALWAIKRDQIGWAGIWIACAAATKQTSWFLVPFFLVYVFRRESFPLSGAGFVRLIQKLAPAIVFWSALVLPFVWWNAGAFVDDVLRYQAGALADGSNYPIKSIGWGGLALGLGWVRDNQAAYPFSWLQLVFGGAACLGLMYVQWRNNAPAQLFTNFAMLALVLSFFSRVFNDNHFGFILTWLILPAFLFGHSEQQRET